MVKRRNLFLLVLASGFFSGTTVKAFADSPRDKFDQLAQDAQKKKEVMDELSPLVEEKKAIRNKFKQIDQDIDENNVKLNVLKAEINQYNASDSTSKGELSDLSQRQETVLRKVGELTQLRDETEARDVALKAKVADVASRINAIEAHEKRLITSLAKLKIYQGDVETCMNLSSSEAIGQCLESHWPGANTETADATSRPPVDPPVVDGRDVPAGLPKAVEKEIPNTPAGNRVRKGFEAIQDHDWKVALAWFQDASNQEPDNDGLKRLVDLAQFTLERRNQKGSAESTDGTKEVLKENLKNLEKGRNEDWERAVNDFNQNYLPKHPELMEPNPSAAPLPKKGDAKKAEDKDGNPHGWAVITDPNWRVFIKDAFTPVKVDKKVLRRGGP